MALYRRSRASLHVKRIATFWTVVVVLVLLVIFLAVAPERIHWNDLPGAADSVHSGEPRRLSSDSNSAYPSDLLIDRPYRDASNKYWIFVHIIVIGYMLLGLNTVCDAYFTGALDEMVDKWKIKPDVAGATFMAAGGSAPELFTSMIGAVIMESDVGFGTIVGSAVFNVLFVIGLCGFAASKPIKLTWWPLFRDCSYYVTWLSVLAVFAKTNRSVELWESVILFIGYICYCILMYFNPRIEASFVGAVGNVQSQISKLAQVAPVPDTGSTGGGEEEVPEVCMAPEDRHHIRKTQPTFKRQSTALKLNALPLDRREPEGEGGGLEEDNTELEKAYSTDSVGKLSSPQAVVEEDEIDQLIQVPEGKLTQVVWIVSLPIYGPLYYLTPKPDTHFMATFFVSLCWIGTFSFWLVYCVEVLGEVMHIHIVVMGFTLLAAGTSIPDAVSSVAVARAGEGDMAISSSIGSNIFDILVGLPVPWMIKIVFVEMAAKGRTHAAVSIQSKYIVIYMLILIVMVGLVVLSIHALGWVLNRTLGIGMAILYAIFLGTVLAVEFNQPTWLQI